MDGPRFDSLTRALAAPISRRGVIATIFGAVAAGLGPGVTPAAADEHVDIVEDAARRSPFWRAGKRCTGPDRCGVRAPCTDGRCVPDSCLVGDATVPANTTNPDNPCAYCLPSASSWTGWAGTKGDGATCQASGAAVNPCLVDAGQCVAAVWVRNPLPNGELCGPGGVCCGGDCCTVTQCCGESGVCEECGPHCTIDGIPHPEGTPNPDFSCTACNPAADPFYWSTAPDDMACGPNRDQFCCAGNCQPEPCGPRCTIEGTPYAADGPNVDHPCQICDPARDATAWSLIGNGDPCNDAQGGVCCGGVCCSSNPKECCSSAGQCTFNCDVCTIEGTDYDNLEPNLDHACERCDTSVATDGWSAQAQGWKCSDNPYRVCCSGTCCPPDQCCGPTGLCEPCQPACAGDGSWCGPNNNQSCCDGECCDYGAYCGLPGTCACCPAGQRCNGGVCEPW